MECEEAGGQSPDAEVAVGGQQSAAGSLGQSALHTEMCQSPSLCQETILWKTISLGMHLEALSIRRPGLMQLALQTQDGSVCGKGWY